MDDNKNSWAKFTSWQCVLPPSRPARWQLRIIRNAVKHISRESPVAVLGSTIEFRDLLSELGFQKIYIFERNIGFYRYITPFARNTLIETVVEGNWLNTLPLYKNTFSIILSDLTSGNIPYDSRDSFYQSISDALSDDGVFLDRVLTNEAPFLNIDKLIKNYSHRKVTQKSANDFNCEVLFCSTLLNSAHVVDSSKFYDFLLSNGNKRIDAFVSACYSITPRDCIWWYGNPWQEEQLRYKKFFTIMSFYEEPPKSAYYRRALLMKSQKQNSLKSE